MHPYQCRNLVFLCCRQWLVVDGRDLQAVKRGEPHHLRIDKVSRVDLRIEDVCQLLYPGTSKLIQIEVTRCFGCAKTEQQVLLAL